MRASLSLRARIIVLVLAVALLPLGLVGWWLTRTAARSGEELLRLRLDEMLERTVADFGPRWVAQRSALLSLGEHEAVQDLLAGKGGRPVSAPADLRRSFAAVDAAIESLDVRDDSGHVLWTLARENPVPSDEVLGSAPLAVRLDVFEHTSGKRIGTLEARLSTSAILSPRASTFASGAAIAVIDPATGASLVATPFDPANLGSRQFQWGGEPWLTERRDLADPRLELVAAAPLGPFTQPFEGAARRGLWVLVGAAATGLLLAAAITARMTRRLRHLAAAADAVAHGDLTRKTEVTGNDEVARVAQAFNTMTESLEHTLGELAKRESLVAVGLSHRSWRMKSGIRSRPFASISNWWRNVCPPNRPCATSSVGRWQKSSSWTPRCRASCSSRAVGASSRPRSISWTYCGQRFMRHSPSSIGGTRFWRPTWSRVQCSCGATPARSVR